MKRDVCKSCGAQILKVTTENNKTMPLDAEPNPKGNAVILKGIVSILKKDDKRPDASVPLYMPHFATCPSVQRHRRK